MQRLQERCEEAKTEAASRFLLLGRHTKLLTEENVLALLAALPEILERDPEHEQAHSLLERARARGHPLPQTHRIRLAVQEPKGRGL